MCIHSCLASITKQQKEKQREKGKLGCLIFWFSHIYGALSSGFVTLSVLRTTEACLHCLIALFHLHRRLFQNQASEGQPVLRQRGLSGPQRLNCFVFSKILACSLAEKCNGGEITHALGSQIRGSRWHTDMKRGLGAFSCACREYNKEF